VEHWRRTIDDSLAQGVEAPARVGEGGGGARAGTRVYRGCAPVGRVARGEAPQCGKVHARGGGTLPALI
jgi:hypothetical protein